MINTLSAARLGSLLTSAAYGISQGFRHLGKIASSVAQYVGRLVSPKADMTDAPQRSVLANIQPTPESIPPRQAQVPAQTQARIYNWRSMPKSSSLPNMRAYETPASDSAQGNVTSSNPSRSSAQAEQPNTASSTSAHQNANISQFPFQQTLVQIEECDDQASLEDSSVSSAEIAPHHGALVGSSVEWHEQVNIPLINEPPSMDSAEDVVNNSRRNDDANNLNANNLNANNLNANNDAQYNAPENSVSDGVDQNSNEPNHAETSNNGTNNEETNIVEISGAEISSAETNNIAQEALAENTTDSISSDSYNVNLHNIDTDNDTPTPAPRFNQARESVDDASNPSEEHANTVTEPQKHQRQRIVLCENDAGKSPHFIKDPKKIKQNFIDKITGDYGIALTDEPPAQTWWQYLKREETNTVLDGVFKELHRNLCEPWAGESHEMSWDLRHVNPEKTSAVERALFKMDAESDHPELAEKPKAGNGIFTSNQRQYQVILNALTNTLRELADQDSDQNLDAKISELKADMNDPNFWRDLVIDAPQVAPAGYPDRSMFEAMANTFKNYYSYGVVGKGLEDIAEQVKNNKPFLATVHHTANTTEITPFHQHMDELVKAHQQADCSYDTNRPVRTLAHSSFHAKEFFQRIMDGSGTLTASQNVSRSMLNKKQTQGIICATGGTPEAKRPSTQRHETLWKKIDGSQRNGLAALSIDTQTPVTVVTCPNADELYNVYQSDYADKQYKEGRTSAMCAYSLLKAPFYLFYGYLNPFGPMFSAPLPLKSHTSGLIAPPAALKMDDFDSYAEYEKANQSLATAFSHHLEGQQQEQIYFDLAYTHRDDLGTDRKTTFLIYKMLEQLIKSDAPDLEDYAARNPEAASGNLVHARIKHAVETFKDEYKKFQQEQQAAGLPDSLNNAFSPSLIRNLYAVANNFDHVSDFFHIDSCIKTYRDTICHIEAFESKLSPTERETQKTWFDIRNSYSPYAMFKRNYQYFGPALLNNLYLVAKLATGLASKRIIGSGTTYA